jgi:hypothetical protein
VGKQGVSCRFSLEPIITNPFTVLKCFWWKVSAPALSFDRAMPEITKGVVLPRTGSFEDHLG